MCKIGLFFVCDYPTKDDFLRAVRLSEKYGIDFLEIGIPFSDPTADGAVIEKAALQVLKREKMSDFYRSIKEARGIYSGKLYIMTYANVVFAAGIDTFAERFSFIDGIILADVPFVESYRFRKVFNRYKIGFVNFVTPESSVETIKKIKKQANDFIYFVSIRGTTGDEFVLDADAIERLELLKDSRQDVIIGFGIRKKDDIEKACRYADGVIIGTAAIKSLESKTFEKFVLSIK